MNDGILAKFTHNLMELIYAKQLNDHLLIGYLRSPISPRSPVLRTIPVEINTGICILNSYHTLFRHFLATVTLAAKTNKADNVAISPA